MTDPAGDAPILEQNVLEPVHASRRVDQQVRGILDQASRARDPAELVDQEGRNDRRRAEEAAAAARIEADRLAAEEAARIEAEEAARAAAEEAAAGASPANRRACRVSSTWPAANAPCAAP